MPVLASEAMHGLSRDILSRAWKHLALEEHVSLKDVVGQAQSWHDRGVLFADAPTDTAEDCQDDNFEDEADNELDDHEEHFQPRKERPRPPKRYEVSS
eukprot:5736262-Amphidinium_carterae.1